MRVKIIDDDGKEIGCLERSYLVRLGLRHQIARVMLYCKEDSSILLQQRSLTKDSCPGMWDTSSSGHVDAHEDAIDAARRELYEEIGIHADASDLTYIGSFDTKEQLTDGMLKRETVVYGLGITSNEDVQPRVDPIELNGIEWVAISKINKFTLTPGAQQSLHLFSEWYHRGRQDS